jgi:membrane-associated phospholipid phosphatase
MANALLIATSAGIDVFGLYIFGAAVFGHTTRPLVAVLIVFALRQLCQLLVSLPAPPGMIWRYPGFPSLLVTYHVENDFFFSGHTAVSAVAMLALVHVAPWWLAALAVVLTAIEAGTVIVLRAHYTMDVFAAIFAAFFADVAAGWIAPGLDTLLRGLA